MDQKMMRRRVDVSNSINGVTTVGSWYKAGHFDNDEQALGAFKLAYQQGLDSMGESISAWMGLNEDEFAEWMKNDTLPKKMSKC